MPLPAHDRDLIQIMDAAWADAARRAGPHLACRLGCTQCCHGAFAINALDAARLRTGMDELRASDPERAVELERRALTWIAEHGSTFPGDPLTGALGDADVDAFEDFANEAACPALDPATGRCDVYAWRPLTCRVFGPPVRIEGDALGCCELCFTQATEEEIAACEMLVPHELEDKILSAIDDDTRTVVAYALLKRAALPAR
jgi:Fe-S-cluster containining protein